MKTMDINLKQFDLDGFIEAHLAFSRRLGSELAPEFIAEIIDEEGEFVRLPLDGPPPDLKAELKKGNALFFPFHEVYAGQEEVKCVDGQDLRVPDQDDPAWDEKYESLPAETDNYGVVVQIKGDTVQIAPALNCGGACMGPPPSADEVEDCGPFDDQMQAFYKQFIR